MSRRFRPIRRLRNDLVSLAFVAIAPIALVSVFPFAALRPLPAQPSQDDAALCAFVTLSPDEERAALAAARVAWQRDRDADRRMRTDLFADTLPPMPPREVGKFETRYRAVRDAPAPYAPDPLPSTFAAPPPAKIAPSDDAGKSVPTFSREELLRLNYCSGNEIHWSVGRVAPRPPQSSHNETQRWSGIAAVRGLTALPA